MISSRFAPGMAALAILAAIPVVLHRYVGLEVDDCARSAELLPRSRDASGVTDREATLAQRFRATRWSEGEISGPTPLRFTHLATYDARRAYYRPENALIEAQDPVSRELEWDEGEAGRLPIHRPLYVSPFESGTRILAGYVLLYGGRPIANPYTAQLRWAPLQLVTGRRPLTLLFVHGRVDREDYPEAERALRAELARATARHRDLCGFGASGR